MKKSNYETMRDDMQLQFLNYEQERMIRKYSLHSDEKYIYIPFVGRQYRINRTNGRVEWCSDEKGNYIVASYNEAMSIYDVLCCFKEGCLLSGKFCSSNQLRGIVQSSGMGSPILAGITSYFDGKTTQLSRACERLGGVKEHVGDVSYRLQPFDFMPMILQFWDSDEDFPANLKVMWDENVLDFMHYETTWFIVSHVMSRLREIMEEAFFKNTLECV